MVLKMTLFLVVFLVYYVEYAIGDCNLSIKKDFGSPAPVFLRNGAFLAPSDRGAISFTASETLKVACPGSDKFHIVLKSGKDTANNVHANINTNSRVMDAQCVDGTSFRVQQYIVQMKDITCSSPPWSDLEDTRVPCHAGSSLYSVGFKVENHHYKLYEACYNRGTLSTVYVKHEISPSSTYTQSGRPNNFIEGDLFKNTNIKELYTTTLHKKRLDAILGPDMHKNFINDSQYLTRGHLAPQSDFSFFAQKRLSFHFINIAPQWESSNNGEWEDLESDLKRRVKSLGTKLTVFTGTHGVLELPDNNNKMTPIYLFVDANRNNVLAVPKYFYKLVYNAKDKSATAFITINSAFYTEAQVKSLRFCKDICAGKTEFKWLSWRPTKETNYFCCSYEDFIKEITYLPALDVVKPKQPSKGRGRKG